MIIINEPFVSEFLKDTLSEMQIPVLKNNFAKNLNKQNFNFIDQVQAVEKIKNGEISKIYSNSENSINWINKNLSFTSLPNKINIFKDKFKFREIIKPLYPDFYFKKINIEEIDSIDINNLKLPFIIKPSVGFFSMGIYIVNNENDWKKTKKLLNNELKTIKGLYPKEVMDASSFIIEEIIDGEEFAVDTYFNDKGKAVIMNIYKHIFSSSTDVSDRAYYTSKNIIENNYDKFYNIIQQIGKISELSNFPMHIEFRINNKGKAIPIEANPMRFAGMCTADMTYFAYGINPYDYYLNQKEPDWNEILKDKKDKQYNLTIGDISKDIKLSDIASIDYEAFVRDFERPLNLRKMDYKTYPVFAFMFSETSEKDTREFDYFLKSDLKKYIIMK